MPFKLECAGKSNVGAKNNVGSGGGKHYTQRFPSIQTFNLCHASPFMTDNNTITETSCNEQATEQAFLLQTLCLIESITNLLR